MGRHQQDRLVLYVNSKATAQRSGGRYESKTIDKFSENFVIWQMFAFS